MSVKHLKNRSRLNSVMEITNKVIVRIAYLIAGLLLTTTIASAAEPAQQTQQSTSTLKQQQGQQANNQAQQVANPKLQKMLQQLESCRQRVNQLTDYTATFTKYELVKNQRVMQTMQLKHRPQPFSVHLQFLSGNPKAQHVVYQQGTNNNQIKVKVAGAAAFLVPSISLPPTSPRAMEMSRHPITEIGLNGLLTGVIKMWQHDLKYSDMTVEFYKDAKINKSVPTSYYAFRTKHPRPREIMRFQETILYIDKTTLLPVQLINKGFPPQPNTPPVLVEQYTYTDLKTNVGLTNATFDSRTYGY